MCVCVCENNQNTIEQSSQNSTRTTFPLIAVFRSLFQVLLCFTDLQKCSFHTLIDFRLTASCKKPPMSRKTPTDAKLTAQIFVCSPVCVCSCVRACVSGDERLYPRHQMFFFSKFISKVSAGKPQIFEGGCTNEPISAAT